MGRISQVKLDNKTNKTQTSVAQANSLFLTPIHVHIPLAGVLFHCILIGDPVLWNDITLHHRRERAGGTAHFCSYLCSDFTVQGKLCVHTLLQGGIKERGAWYW